MRPGCPRSALWPISDPSSTNSALILRRKVISTTSASNCAKPPRPCRRMSKNLRFLMTANTREEQVRRGGTRDLQEFSPPHAELLAIQHERTIAPEFGEWDTGVAVLDGYAGGSAPV